MEGKLLAPSVCNRLVDMDHACPAHLRLTSPDFAAMCIDGGEWLADDDKEERIQLALEAREARRLREEAVKDERRKARALEIEANRAGREAYAQERRAARAAGKSVKAHPGAILFGDSALRPLGHPRADWKELDRPPGCMTKREVVAKLAGTQTPRAMTTLDKAIREGRLVAIKINGCHWITPAALVAYLFDSRMSKIKAAKAAQARRWAKEEVPA